MSRKQRQQPRKAGQPKHPPAREREPGLPTQIVAAVFAQPRMVRIVVVALFALAVTLVMSPIVDGVYLRYFFSRATRIVPSLVSAAFGSLMYLLGWWLLVGVEVDEVHSRWLVLWYLSLGLLALLLTIILSIIGYIIGTEPF